MGLIDSFGFLDEFRRMNARQVVLWFVGQLEAITKTLYLEVLKSGSRVAASAGPKLPSNPIFSPNPLISPNPNSNPNPILTLILSTLSLGCHIRNGTYLMLSRTQTITLTLLILTVTVRVKITLRTIPALITVILGIVVNMSLFDTRKWSDDYWTRTRTRTLNSMFAESYIIWYTVFMLWCENRGNPMTVYRHRQICSLAWQIHNGT